MVEKRLSAININLGGGKSPRLVLIPVLISSHRHSSDPWQNYAHSFILPNAFWLVSIIEVLFLAVSHSKEAVSGEGSGPDLGVLCVTAIRELLRPTIGGEMLPMNGLTPGDNGGQNDCPGEIRML